jgi:hypothetical protein
MELLLPPGIVRGKSESAAIDRWIDGAWIRFVPDPRKIGGCEQILDTVLLGTVRSALAWDAARGIEERAFASEKKVYASDFLTEPANITPLRLNGVALPAAPFATTNASTNVVVHYVAHDANQGDTVVFHGATAGNGVTINGEYLITGVVDADHFSITHSVAANATSSVGGAGVTADFEVNIGAASASRAFGFGTGRFGEGFFGTPRTLSTLVLEGRFWSLDNYGTDLIAAYQGSRVYLFDSSVDTRLQILANSPSDVRFVFVTEERFIMELCDDMTLKWPDRDDPTDATPSELNTANTRRIAKGNRLMCGTALGGGISLIWTDSTLYVAQFTGDEFIYDTRVIPGAAGACSPAAFAIADGSAFWTDGVHLHMFQNAVTPIPNVEDVQSWFTENITPEHRAKVYCFFNKAKREVWTCFPAFGASEASHFVALNIDRFDWTSGEIPEGMRRTAATNSERSGLLMVSADGLVCQHEVGVDMDGEAIGWSLKSGLFNSPDGVKSMDVIGFVLDTKTHVGDINLRLRAQDFPETAAETEDKTLSPGGGRVDPRISGAYFGMELSQEVVGGDYHGGRNILLTQPGGDR